jgi:hypothetical protein
MQQMEGQGGQEESVALEHVVAQQRNVLAEAKVVVIAHSSLYWFCSIILSLQLAIMW